MSQQDTLSKKSIGTITPQTVELFNDSNPLKLECGAKLAPVDVQYETYGTLNKTADNAILICHALSGDAHAAGKHSSDDAKPGWWDDMIGPGKAFDTDQFYIICSNFLGGCKGTTGPSSINPKTGKNYGNRFPIFTLHDMVVVQKALIEALGISKLLAIAGGSMGGMQALEWAVSYPNMVHGIIPIATTYRLSAQGIALNEVGRQAIFADPNWKNGNYSEDSTPDTGLALARMIAHITYLSAESMHEKFGRDLRHQDTYKYNFEEEFQVESYLHYQGNRFTQRFDANTYLYITKAMDYFDMTAGYGSLQESLKQTLAKFLLIGFSSDWLFPPDDMKEIANALRKNGSDVTYITLESSYGHDAFLLELDSLTKLISGFLRYLYKETAHE